jgi:membrane protease YdiL (CAAX protease family)
VDAQRIAVFQEEGTMTRRQARGAYGIASAGVLTSSIAMTSSQFDRAVFGILASGSILLAIAIASAFLEMVFRALAWRSERSQQHAPASGD